MYLATFFTLLILLIILFALFLFMYPVKVAASFNSEVEPDMHIMMSWLSPFLKAYITRQEGATDLTINLFNKRILTKKLTDKNIFDSSLKRRKYMDYVNMAKSLKVDKAKLSAVYGFANPAVTGILCGAINIISDYINIHELYNNPDFFTEISYFNIRTEAEVNAAVSLIRVLRRNTLTSNAHVLGGSR